MIKGIDISNYQSSTYSVDGYDFVFVKATEGVSYVNPKYADQIKRARDKGRVVGHYHFVNGGHSMEAQADYFLSKADEKTGEILALDWESPDVSSEEKDEFLKYLKSKRPDFKIVLYCNTSYWTSRDKSSYKADGLWIAQYNNKPGQPSIKDEWLIHQYTSTPVVDGKTIHLDVNVAKFDTRAKMAEWAGKKPAPNPKPVYAPFPGVGFFRLGKRHDLVTQMGKALVRAGYKGYAQGPGPEFTRADIKAYAWWQRKCGYSGAAADGYPGKSSWDKLKVAKPQ